MFIYSVLSVWCRFAIYKNAVLLSFFLATGGADVNETVPFEARIGGFLCSRYFCFLWWPLDSATSKSNRRYVALLKPFLKIGFWACGLAHDSIELISIPSKNKTTTTNGTLSMPLAQAFDEHSGAAIFVFVVTDRWRH